MLTLILGCTPEPACGDSLYCDVAAERRADVPPVLTVRWTSAEPTLGRVRFGASSDDLAFETALEAEATTEHEHHLVGLPANTEGFFQVVDDLGSSPVLSATTGGLSPDLPDLTVTGSAGLGGFVVIALEGSLWGPVILDPQGNIVWWDEATPDFAVTRAYLSKDRTAVLYNESNDRGDEYEEMAEGYVVRVPLDGSGAERLEFPYLSHDFVELPGGELVGIARYEEAVDGVTYLGDKLVERALDGSFTDRWSAFDDYDPLTTGADDVRGTWTHANAVDYDEASDSLLVGLRNFASIVRVSRQTSEVTWSFGGLVGAVRPSADEGGRDTYHQFVVDDNRVLAFDNGSEGRGYTRLVEYDLAGGAPEPTLSWEWTEDPATYVPVLGDVNVVGEGDVLASLSLEGQILRVDREGEVVFGVASQLGYGFGYAQVVDSLY